MDSIPLDGPATENRPSDLHREIRLCFRTTYVRGEQRFRRSKGGASRRAGRYAGRSGTRIVGRAHRWGWILGGLVGAGLLLIYASLIVVPMTRSVVTGGLLGTDDRSEVLARAIAAILALCSIGSTILY